MTVVEPPAPVEVTTRPPRSLAPDLARGLMLALIALANIPWFLWGQPTAAVGAHVPARNSLDTVIQVVMAMGVDGRSFPLFAFLFGYGMVQFYRSRIDRGLEHRTVRRMLRRRHWAMLLLGFLHALLLFLGDILGAYAVAGLLLVWIFFGRHDRTLIIWTAVIGGLLALYGVLGAISGLFLSTQPEIVAGMGDAGAAGAMSSSVFRDLAHGESNYLIAAGLRVGMWAFAILPTALGAAVPVSIMLGWLAARHRVLDEPWNHLRLLRWTAVIGVTIGWIGGLPDVLMVLGVIELPEPLFWTFMGSDMAAGLAGGIGYAAAFGLIAAHLEGRTTPTRGRSARVRGPKERIRKRDLSPQERIALVSRRSYGEPADQGDPGPRRPLPAPLRAVSAVGQRSLSFYLFQSVVFAPLLAAWGLGLGRHLSTWQAAAIAVAVWLASVGIAWLMDRRDVRGPAERLLRRMAYGKLDPALSAPRTRFHAPVAEGQRPEQGAVSPEG